MPERDGEAGGRVEGDEWGVQTECNGGENEMATAGSIDPPCGRRLFSRMAASCLHLTRPCAHTPADTCLCVDKQTQMISPVRAPRPRAQSVSQIWGEMERKGECAHLLASGKIGHK